MVFKMRSNSGGKYGLDFRLKKKRDCFPKNNQNRTFYQTIYPPLPNHTLFC